MLHPTNFLHTTILRLLCCLALPLLAPVAAHAACSVQRRAQVPLQDIHGHLLVPVMVNGSKARFVLDTGAERSMVSPQAVERLHLRLDKWVGTRMHGIGGIIEHPNADPRALTLGGVPLHRHTITHDTSLTVGPMPQAEIAGTRIDGLLGRDFLSLFDLELDTRAGTLTLYHVQDCHGPFLPWTQPYVAIAARQPTDTAMVVPVRLDGVPLQALLDTGASASVLTARGMIRLGLTPKRVARDATAQARGIGPRAATMRRHRFATLRIGAETEHDPLLWAARIRVVPFVDMLLGADWLARRKVWISFATAQVFVSVDAKKFAAPASGH